MVDRFDFSWEHAVVVSSGRESGNGLDETLIFISPGSFIVESMVPSQHRGRTGRQRTKPSQRHVSGHIVLVPSLPAVVEHHDFTRESPRSEKSALEKYFSQVRLSRGDAARWPTS